MKEIIIPKNIRVGGRTYTVIYPYKFKEKKTLIGQCDNLLQEIRLADSDESGNRLAEDSIISAFLHEVLHAIDYVYNNNSLEENSINSLAEGLLQVFDWKNRFSNLK